MPVAKKRIILDVVFYFIIPLVVWNWGRKAFGDYYGMLLSTMPACIYGISLFFREKQYNVTGIFILLTLIIGKILDIASSSAVQILWNGVYLCVAYACFWTLTVAVKMPMGMYFFIDYAYLQGYSREDTRLLYRNKDIFLQFQLFTAMFAVKDLEAAAIRAWLIKLFGVAGFNQIFIITNINNCLFTAITAIYVLFILNKIKKLA